MKAIITTESVYGRHDWYHSVGEYNGRTYNADMTSRHAAFMEVARQIVVRMEADALEAKTSV